MASFPANVYGGGCNALRPRWAKAGTEIASSILDRRKGEERFTIWGTGSPREFVSTVFTWAHV